MAVQTPIEMGSPIVLVRDDGYARAALATRIQEPPKGATGHAVVDCVVINDLGQVEPHTNIPHVDADDATPLKWRRETDHPTSGEFSRESSR